MPIGFLFCDLIRNNNPIVFYSFVLFFIYRSGSEKCINKNWDKEIISLSVIAVLTIVVHVCLIVFKQKPCKKENQPGCHEYTSTLQNVDDGSWQTQSPI